MFEHLYWATEVESSSFSVEIPLFSMPSKYEDDEVSYEWFIEDKS